MKILSMVAAIALSLSSTLAAAQQAGNPTGPSAGQPPRPGPVAGHPLEAGAVPAVAIAVGGLVLLGGLAVVLLGTSDSNNNTNRPNLKVK